MKRLVLVLLAAIAGTVAACDRVVDLTPAPDARAPDGGISGGNDARDGGIGNDGGFDGGIAADGGAGPDA
jgi:hypothetical protein